MDSFDNFIVYFGYFFIFSFLLGILGFVSFFVGRNSVDKPKKFYIIGAILISQLILTVVLLYFFHYRFAYKLREDIGQIVEFKELQINLNDSIASKSFRDSITIELKNIRNVYTNHTRPDFEINMALIAKNKKIHLLLGRDSGDSTLYWIYVKDYRTSRHNDIGKIRTELLDYLK